MDKSYETEYTISVTVNSRKIQKVIIDDHYEAKHKSVIHDELILSLVKSLDGGTYPIQDRNAPYEYFVTDKMEFEGRLYKLVRLLEVVMGFPTEAYSMRYLFPKFIFNFSK